MTRIVACLYVDLERGPYPSMEDVELWGLPDRDARLYQGPHPVVAHPPCGPWGFLARGAYGKRPTAATMATKDCGIAAVASVRRWGGVLEHPASSLLWEECHMPRPCHLPDAFGGVTIGIQQVEWGGPTRKPTWLYCVGCADLAPAPFPGRQPIAALAGSRRDGYTGRHLPKSQRHLTPPMLAAELVRLARTVRS